MTEVAPKRSTLAMTSMIFIVLSQSPALAILATWDLQGRKLYDEATLPYLIAFFSPPVLWLGWLIAIPTMLWSERARKNPIVWMALAIGVGGWLKYESVIWTPLKNVKFY